MEETRARAHRGQWIAAPLGSLLALGGYATLVLLYLAFVAHRGGPVWLRVVGALPLLPPVLGAVIGARLGRGRPVVTRIWYAAVGALLALATVAVLLYGIAATVAVFTH